MTKTGTAKNAIHLRSDLGPVVLQVPRRDASEGGRAMIEAAASILALFSMAIFAAHALDAYRTGR